MGGGLIAGFLCIWKTIFEPPLGYDMIKFYGAPISPSGSQFLPEVPTLTEVLGNARKCSVAPAETPFQSPYEVPAQADAIWSTPSLRHTQVGDTGQLGKTKKVVLMSLILLILMAAVVAILTAIHQKGCPLFHFSFFYNSFIFSLLLAPFSSSLLPPHPSFHIVPLSSSSSTVLII